MLYLVLEHIDLWQLLLHFNLALHSLIISFHKNRKKGSKLGKNTESKSATGMFAELEGGGRNGVRKIRSYYIGFFLCGLAREALFLEQNFELRHAKQYCGKLML